VVLTLPDNLSLPELTEQQVTEDLAVSFYAARRITLVQAADMAKLPLIDFQRLLRDRRIPQHYDETDLEDDLLTLRDLPRR
jgi:predicted HTH domain antitoxin